MREWHSRLLTIGASADRAGLLAKRIRGGHGEEPSANETLDDRKHRTLLLCRRRPESIVTDLWLWAPAFAG
jgi:hypothetical protein